MHSLLFLISISLIVATTSRTTASTIHVPGNQPTIQAGLGAASAGDTVSVANGTYVENIIWPAVNGIKLIGSGQDDCVIDGDDEDCVLRLEEDIVGTIDTTTLIMGFTILNGFYSSYEWEYPRASGINCVNTSPRLINLTIRENRSSRAVRCITSDVIMQSVLIIDNSGGGIAFSNSDPLLHTVEICNNSSADGAGILSYGSNPVLVDVLISGNSGQEGGGIYFRQSHPILQNVTLIENSSTYRGGGIYCTESELFMENVDITRNFSDLGGGLYIEDSSLDFSTENRCSIYLNGISGRSFGTDIATNCFTEVIVDTFTVVNPTDYHATPISHFTFDIQHAIMTQVEADLYVSPDGDNSNDGLTPETPLRNIYYATNMIQADSLHPYTIYLAEGVYSDSTNSESFPVRIPGYVSLIGASRDGVILNGESSEPGIQITENNDHTIVSTMTITGTGGGINGGGIFITDTSPCIRDITFRDNVQRGIALENSDAVLMDLILIGDGISIGNSTTILTDIQIIRSTGTGGGSIGCYRSSVTLTNVLVEYHYASVCGGIFVNESDLTLVNCTLVGSEPEHWNDGFICIEDQSDITMENCILWSNSPCTIFFDHYGDESSVTISCCDIQGGQAYIETNGHGAVNWLQNNIDADPQFCSPYYNDYRLQLDSPCRTEVCGFMGYTGENCYGVGVDDPVAMPTDFYLADAHPNPFNPSTTIEYGLLTPVDVQLSVYNIQGQLVDVIQDGHMTAGQHTAVWVPADLSSGIYLVELCAGGYREVVKVMYVK